MKHFKYLITLAGVLLISNNISAKDYDFRKTRWGMPIAQVKAIENLNSQWEFFVERPAENSISKIIVAYTGRLLDHKCILVYQFTDGHLSEGAYNFNVGKLDIRELKELYDNILKTLLNKYGDGTPIRDTGMKWITNKKQTEILLEYNEQHDSIQVLYLSLSDKSTNSTADKDAF